MSAINLLTSPATTQTTAAATRANAAADRTMRSFRDELQLARPRPAPRAPAPAAERLERPDSVDQAADDATSIDDDDLTTNATDKAVAADTDDLDTDKGDAEAVEEQPFVADRRVDFKLRIDTPLGQAIATGSLFLDDALPGLAQVTPLFIQNTLGEIDPSLLAGLPVEFSVTSGAAAASTLSATPATPMPTTGVAAGAELAAVAVPQLEVATSTQGDASAEGEGSPGQSTGTATAATATANASNAAAFNLLNGEMTPAMLTPAGPDAAVARGPEPDASGLLAPATGLTAEGDDSEALNSARITRGLNNAVNQQGGTVTLRLTPPEMGTVRIQLQMQGGSVSAQFHAETESARSLLNQQLGTLRSALEAQGLSVDKLGVQSLGSSGSAHLQNNTSDSQQQSTSQQHDTPGDGRSRGRFDQQQQQQQQQQTARGGVLPEDDPSERPRRFRAFFGDA